MKFPLLLNGKPCYSWDDYKAQAHAIAEEKQREFRREVITRVLTSPELEDQLDVDELDAEMAKNFEMSKAQVEELLEEIRPQFENS